MSFTNIPGNPNNYPANIRGANGADARNATTEDAGISDLADRTSYLTARMGGQVSAAGVWYPIPISAYVPEDITAGVEWTLIADIGGGDGVHYLPGVKTASTASTSVMNNFVLHLSPFLPPSGILREFQVTLFGTGHGSTMPANMPYAMLYNYDPNTMEFDDFVGPDTAQPCEDTTVLVADYETHHDMGLPGLSGGTYPIIDLATYRGLFLRIISEWGTGAQNGTTFYNVRCKVASVGW